ncbi:hypothetical protein, partial [Pseudomonas aeruginosa]
INLFSISSISLDERFFSKEIHRSVLSIINQAKARWQHAPTRKSAFFPGDRTAGRRGGYHGNG